LKGGLLVHGSTTGEKSGDGSQNQKTDFGMDSFLKWMIERHSQAPEIKGHQ
jgi:hypothetical protein